jgi:hypothetical protein
MSMDLSWLPNSKQGLKVLLRPLINLERAGDEFPELNNVDLPVSPS